MRWRFGGMVLLFAGVSLSPGQKPELPHGQADIENLLNQAQGGGEPASSPKAPEFVDFCEVVKSPERFENRVITTKGILLPGEHSLGFYDPACRPTETNKMNTQGVLDRRWGQSR